MNSETPDSDAQSNPANPIGQRNLVLRVLYAALGVVFVAIAAVGVFLPGIPTVGPLLLASVFLTKSSPRLEQKLVRNKLFAAYLHYLDGTKELSPRAKWSAAIMMWLSIFISCLVFYFAGTAPTWVIPVMIIAGIVGSFFIARFGRKSIKNNHPVPMTDD
ncbi:MAG: YbaN family protein [Planctomycetota bacterium]